MKHKHSLVKKDGTVQRYMIKDENFRKYYRRAKPYRRMVKGESRRVYEKKPPEIPLPPAEFFGVTLVTAFNTREGWRTSSFELWVRGLVLEGRHKEKFFVELCGKLDDEFRITDDLLWLYNIEQIDPPETPKLELLGNYWGVEEEPSTFDYERLGVKVTVYRTGGGMYTEVKACRKSLRLTWTGGHLKVG